ncbi:MAG: PilZ domain-containing protein [Deltaproteobacteria bacterium]|nr:PilZ domain-containing protein [Deltaproteobacteria bacterium]
MARTARQQDRRLAPRAQALGRAVVFDGPAANEYRVENLSAGGALLAGVPVPAVGTRLQMVLRVGSIPSEVIEARVTYQVGNARPGFAVAFVELDASLQDLIQDVVLAAMRGFHQPVRPAEGIVEWASLIP